MGYLPGMAHDHLHHHGAGGHHHHAPDVTARNEKVTLGAAALTGSFMLAELIGGLITGSLALLADAAHMLTDFASLALAWLAFRLSRRPADPRRSYGFDRLQVLAAFANAVTLLILVVWITAEAVSRLVTPEPVMAGGMMVIAVLGLGVNVAAFALLHAGDRANLNIRGAIVHVLGDLLGSVAAIAAAGVILVTGWTPIDPLLSILVAILVAVSAVRLLRDSGRVLLEAAPAHLDPEAIIQDLSDLSEVEEVHHLHIWSLTPERPMATLHACVADGAAPDAAVQAVKQRLKVRFGLAHVTVEAETGRCADRA